MHNINFSGVGERKGPRSLKNSHFASKGIIKVKCQSGLLSILFKKLDVVHKCLHALMKALDSH